VYRSGHLLRWVLPDPAHPFKTATCATSTGCNNGGIRKEVFVIGKVCNTFGNDSNRNGFCTVVGNPNRNIPGGSGSTALLDNFGGDSDLNVGGSGRENLIKVDRNVLGGSARSVLLESFDGHSGRGVTIGDSNSCSGSKFNHDSGCSCCIWTIYGQQNPV